MKYIVRITQPRFGESFYSDSDRGIYNKNKDTALRFNSYYQAMRYMAIALDPCYRGLEEPVTITIEAVEGRTEEEILAAFEQQRRHFSTKKL